MATTLPTTSSSYLHSTTKLPHPSLSCASKVFVGLRVQSPNSYGIATSNVNVEFYNRVYKSIESGSRNSKPTRSQVSMMPIGTPRVPYRNPTEGTWQWVDLWNALYRERVIFIGEEINEEFSNQILATMLYLDSIDDSKKLYLYINGPGGDLTPTMAIYDTMQSLKSAVGTHCVGYAYNLAAFLLAAGEKYRERVIFIGEEINEEFSNQILATMLYLDSIDDSKKLYLYINGPGGDLTPTMAIYDTMQSLKSAVGTHCVGYAYNLAAFLLAAGEKGNRFAMPLSRIALQSPAGAARGQADDIRNEADELLRIRDYLFKELSEKTGQPVEKVHKDLSRMKRFNAQEALEYGLIDRIVRPPRIKADAPRKDTTAGLG